MAPALIRQVQGAGGFATVLHKGSAWGSAMLIVHRHGARLLVLERMPSLGGGLACGLSWRVAAEGEQEVAAFIEKQRRFDADLWVIELDIVDPARFIPGFPPAD